MVRPAEVRSLKAAAEHPEDAMLVRRARDGDAWAEEALYRRHAARLYEVTARLLGDRADAEDVVQDTFILALQQIDRLRDPAAFGGWVMRIAVRKVHRRFRFRRLLRRLGLSEGPAPVALVPRSESSPETQAMVRELDALVATLPAAQRIAWMLRYVEGYGLGEVAEACGCSLATAKRRVAAAQDAVRGHGEWEAG